MYVEVGSYIDGNGRWDRSSSYDLFFRLIVQCTVLKKPMLCTYEVPCKAVPIPFFLSATATVSTIPIPIYYYYYYY